MTANDTKWRYYEDIKIGEERKSKSLIIAEKDILDFANKYDPQWFHSDVKKAKDSSFKGLIASGIHVAAIWRLLDHDANGNGLPDVGEINVDEEDEGRIQEKPLSLFPVIPSLGFTVYF